MCTFVHILATRSSTGQDGWVLDIIEAHAKLTLSLRVTGVRDDGFHLIDAEMVVLDLHDTIAFTASDDVSITVDGPYAAGVPTDGRNLVHRALALVNRTAAVNITKQIPHGGGLGGGSADAAAVLRWAGYHDLVAASRLGADIPFCLSGHHRARVTGIGEGIESRPSHAGTVTLIIPPLSASTPAVYRAWDELGGPRNTESATSTGLNDLEPAALAVVPELATWRDRIRDASGYLPTLAGSGATWFLEGDHGHIEHELPGAHVVVTGRG